MASSVFPSGGLIHSFTKTLTDAQIKSLPTGPGDVLLLAAPGGGNVAVLVMAYITINTVAGAYTNVNADANMKIINSENDTVSITDATRFKTALEFGSISGQMLISNANPGAGSFAGVLVTGVTEDLALTDGSLVLTGSNVGDGAFTGGNAANYMNVSIAYLLMNVTTGAYS